MVSVLVILAGVAHGVVGWLGWRGGLRRNRFVGIRTAAAMVSEDTFRLANRVAAPVLLAAAAVAVVGGIAALAAPSAGAYTVVLGVAGTGTLGLIAAGGVLGSRAAALAETPRAPAAPAAPAAPGRAPLGSPCASCACAGVSITRCGS
jgi:hypothetical protein